MLQLHRTQCERLIWLYLIFQMQENANESQYPRASGAQETRFRGDALHIETAARPFPTSGIHNYSFREQQIFFLDVHASRV